MKECAFLVAAGFGVGIPLLLASTRIIASQLFLAIDHSWRKATIGSTRVARCAGIQDAASATTARSAAEHAYVRASVRDTPYRKTPDPLQPMPWVGKNRVIANAPDVPTATPASVTRSVSRSTSLAIPVRAAPSATRMPISLVRSVTEYAVTPNTPTTASINANPPNEARRVMSGRRSVSDSEL